MKGTVIGGGGFSANGAQRYLLSMVDLDAPGTPPRRFELPFLPHGIAQDPRQPSRAAVFEKKGAGGAIVDLEAAAVLHLLPLHPQRRFYGHGAWSDDGATIYAVESWIDLAFAGVIVVRDATTLAETAIIETGGASPHDCRLVDGGRVIVVTHGGGALRDRRAAPSMTWVELATGKVLDRALLDSPRFNAGHFDLADDGTVALVSAPREGLPDLSRQLGAVSLRRPGRHAVSVQQPKAVVERMFGETLSVQIHPARRELAATHPAGNLVTWWRLDDGGFVGAVELRDPRGVALTLDGEAWVVSHMGPRGPQLSLFDVAGRSRIGEPVEPAFTSGSHIVITAPLMSAGGPSHEQPP